MSVSSDIILHEQNRIHFLKDAARTPFFPPLDSPPKTERHPPTHTLLLTTFRKESFRISLIRTVGGERVCMEQDPRESVGGLAQGWVRAYHSRSRTAPMPLGITGRSTDFGIRLTKV